MNFVGKNTMIYFIELNKKIMQKQKQKKSFARAIVLPAVILTLATLQAQTIITSATNSFLKFMRDPVGVDMTPADVKIPRREKKETAPDLSEQDEKIEALIKKTFSNDVARALAVAKCENDYNGNGKHYDPARHGDLKTKYKSVGIFQIREIPERMRYYNLTTAKLEDYKINIDIARKIYERRGWSAWSCYTNGDYKKYLNN